jgi:hypothetical protein
MTREWLGRCRAETEKGELDMTEKVSAFWPVENRQFRYLFFIVNWSDYSNSITSSLERNLETFGEDLGIKGAVIQAYKAKKYETFQEVKEKANWPIVVRDRIDSEDYPFMLIINTDFKSFDPQEHKWGIIWFSDFAGNPDTIPKILGNLIKKIKQDEDIFNYFGALNLKQDAKEFMKYFEMKPGIFGFSIDIKAFLNDLLSR